MSEHTIEPENISNLERAGRQHLSDYRCAELDHRVEEIARPSARLSAILTLSGNGVLVGAVL